MKIVQILTELGDQTSPLVWYTYNAWDGFNQILVINSQIGHFSQYASKCISRDAAHAVIPLRWSAN